MILLTYRTPAGLQLGIKTQGGVLDVAAAAVSLDRPDVPTTPEALFRAGSSAMGSLQALLRTAENQHQLLLDEAKLTYGPAVPTPGKIICVGLNYARHAAESGMATPESPVLFAKFGNGLIGSGAPVPLPTNAVEYDYEVELVMVIGKRARSVSRERALDYVFGYATGNDLSARDLQFRSSQWVLGKALDAFMPLGPYVVTADEIGDPQRLGLCTWVNGERRQNSNTSDMIFDCAYLVHYLSQYMTLEPGDLISTGTPEGVITGMKEKRWLQPGDEVTVEVEGLGRLTNRMVPESH